MYENSIEVSSSRKQKNNINNKEKIENQLKKIHYTDFLLCVAFV